jgi:hypothetical protein
VPAAQGFSAMSSFIDIARERICRIRKSASRTTAADHALLAAGFSRQHFFKSEAVFFLVLVYSGCSASRFPSARSD